MVPAPVQKTNVASRVRSPFHNVLWRNGEGERTRHDVEIRKGFLRCGCRRVADAIQSHGFGGGQRIWGRRISGKDTPLAKRLFSIGHSNQDTEALLSLLKEHGVEVVVDVRSSPHSGYASQFDREPLEAALNRAGLKYLFLGKELGGHPDDPACYDGDGHVVYERVAGSAPFLEGIRRLEKGVEKFRVAILCSEEDPARCHRRLLVSRVLASRGIAVDHLRSDGRVQTEQDLALEETGGQGDLFEGLEDGTTWRRSTQSVSRKRRPPSSSGR